MLLFYQNFVRVVKYQKKKKGTIAYKQCKGTDNCQTNHNGSSSSMEAELKPVKLECFGHYQKRTGNWLRQKRKDLKGVKLPDGIGVSGRGRLTDKVINTLQNYVGMAIRQNSNDITEMRNSIIATLYHYTNFQHEESRYLFCSKGKNSWCI